jgi:carboxyl-terminal processing protease
MKDRTVSFGGLASISALVLMLGFAGGFVVAHRGASASTLSDGQPEGVDFAPVWRAWHAIDEKFVPAAVSTTTPLATTTAESNQERVWGLIQGLAASLNDPYTFFLPPVENKQFADDISGKFEGVGMEIAVRDSIVTIVTPLKGTPAERAGIRSGDKVLKIDGEDTRGMDVESAVKKIRGPKGSIVTLTIDRDGWTEPREIEVTRDVINVPVVVTESREDGIFVISLYSFTANSTALFRNALREFIESGDTKLILDVRGNPGGYLDAAVDMASYFLPSGKPVVTEDYGGNTRNIVHRSSGYNVFNENLKMVILVDRGSASASEILADALQAYGIAKLVGTPTFGKGSVQELVEITPETSLKITVARWIGPDGEPIPLTGITPDTEVEMTEEDFAEDRDPQMDKAIEVINAL